MIWQDSGKHKVQADDIRELMLLQDYDVVSARFRWPFYLQQPPATQREFFTLKQFLSSLLEPNPRKRLSASLCKQLDYFSDVDWAAHEQLEIQPPFVPPPLPLGEREPGPIADINEENTEADVTASEDEAFKGFDWSFLS
jgi:hypothetical protein